jgi:hypothetical protein
VARDDSQLLNKFLRLVAADPAYRRRHQDDFQRLLLADERLPRRRLARRVAGEWAYNVAKPGPRSLKLIQRLEAARFDLDVKAFMKEADRLEQAGKEARTARVQAYAQLRKGAKLTRRRPRHTRERLRRLWKAENTARAHFAQVESVREHLQELETAGRIEDGYVEIKSGHYKIINRRYQPSHFWPVEVTGKDIDEELVEMHGGDDWEIEEWRTTSRRGRLFRAAATSSARSREIAQEEDPTYPREWLGDRQPLTGIDVSSSQLQMLAVFLGLKDLETEVTRRSFKEWFAEYAWHRDCTRTDAFKLPRREGVKRYDKPDDPRLKEAAKKAVMTYLYGSKPGRIAFRLNDDPDTFGPGLGDAENITRLINGPKLLQPILTTFLPACRTIADRAFESDPYAGVVLTDPFDRSRVKWNPVRLRLRPVTSGALKVWIDEPQGSRKGGAYPVDLKKLRNMVAPCLVHMLDALFASLVVEALAKRGIRDVVSVHDAWMVAADGERTLDDAFDAAGEPWLRALRPVYKDLDRYLKGTEYTSWVQDCKAKWKRRVAAKRWPKFRASATKLFEADLR